MKIKSKVKKNVAENLGLYQSTCNNLFFFLFAYLMHCEKVTLSVLARIKIGSLTCFVKNALISLVAKVRLRDFKKRCQQDSSSATYLMSISVRINLVCIIGQF